MRSRWLRVPGLAVAALAAACTSDMNVTVSRTPAADAVLAGGPYCAPERLDSPAAAAERGCTALGEAFVGDTGRSVRCTRERVETDLRSVACSLGADAMSVTRVEGSSCFQARGAFYRCADSDD